MCKICPELLIKSREHCQWNCFGSTLIFVNNKQFSRLILVFRFESELVFIYLLNLKLRKNALTLTILPLYGHTNAGNPAANAGRFWKCAWPGIRYYRDQWKYLIFLKKNKYHMESGDETVWFQFEEFRVLFHRAHLSKPKVKRKTKFFK